MSLSKKVAVITGASVGIGAQTAIKFASLDYCLVLTSRNLTELNSVAEKCKLAGLKQNEVLVIQGSMEKTSDLHKIIDGTINHFNRIDVLINNAGDAITRGTLETINESIFDAIMKVNLFAPMYLTKLATPHLIKTKGCVLNCSSVYGHICIPEMVIYGASKAALIHFTKTAAKELGPYGVRVISISPAHVKTPLYGKLGLSSEQQEKYFDNVSKFYPIRRVANSEDIANAFAFFASTEASFFTGVDIPLDGGALASQPVALPSTTSDLLQ